VSDAAATSPARSTVRASEVRLGDRLRAPTGEDMTVTRIDTRFFGRPEFIAFVEDSEERWLKLPVPADGEVEVVRPRQPGDS
jgi:hypothetical protein